MNKKLAIIDQNAASATALKMVLRNRFEGMEISAFAEPAAPIGFDIFIVAANLLTEASGENLIPRIRNVASNSLILAYSDDLSLDLIKRLMNMGCEGVYDKDKQEDVAELFDKLDFYIDSQAKVASNRGVGGTVNAISALIREWNTRIERNGNAYHRTFGDA